MAIDAPLIPLYRPRKQRKTLPAVWMRAGTSKGLFLHKRDLPPKQEQWTPIILAAMGSQDSDPKQLNGVAGATSTTSKVAVVSPSARPDVDVEYTFVQVSIGSPKLDFTGNCGNIASGVGPFAVDEGMVEIAPGQETVDVRILNTNTGCVIVETLDVDEDGHFLEDGDYLLAGTRSAGSRIGVSFKKPAGSMTGHLLPSGKAVDTLHIPGSVIRPSCDVQASLVDAANPFVLVDEATLPRDIKGQAFHSDIFLDFIEAVRCQGAVKMGLAKDADTAGKTRGTPKVAVLSLPDVDATPHDETPDLRVTSFSMGKVHGSLQLTGGVCLGAAVCTNGTVANRIAKAVSERRASKDSPDLDRKDSFTGLEATSRKVSLKHPGGIIVATVSTSRDEIESVRISRTARRLFEGNVCFVA